jgi:hypothetical protein
MKHSDTKLKPKVGLIKFCFKTVGFIQDFNKIGQQQWKKNSGKQSARLQHLPQLKVVPSSLCKKL